MDPDLRFPPAVNFHLWEPCNMRCRFCYATFQDVKRTVLPRGHLPEEAARQIVDLLAGAGCRKLTFAGGEPTLCPWLPALLARARDQGLTTAVVTNGSRLLDFGYRARLAPLCDWVALSIDSARPEVHEALGRSLKGRAVAPERYLALAEALRRAGVRLKVNTVVTALNAGEDMGPLIRQLAPERWKVLRVLPIAGQNDGSVEPLLIDDATFAAFRARHRDLPGVIAVFEDHEDIVGSYAMVDPAGRFFDNTTSRYRYSAPILSVGVAAAWAEMRFSPERFLGRGGIYDWQGRRHLPVR